MNKTIKVLFLITLTLSVLACGRSDGFKDEAERSFMKAHGFETKDDLNKYKSLGEEDRVTMSARNFAKTVNVDFVITCTSTVNVLKAYFEDRNAGTPEESQALQTTVNLWSYVLEDAINRGDKEKILDSLKEKLAADKAFVYNNPSDNVKAKAIWDRFSDCNRKASPFFEDKLILGYKD